MSSSTQSAARHASSQQLRDPGRGEHLTGPVRGPAAGTKSTRSRRVHCDRLADPGLRILGDLHQPGGVLALKTSCSVARRRSAENTITFFPSSARTAARFATTVLLPSAGPALVTRMMLPRGASPFPSSGTQGHVDAGPHQPERVALRARWDGPR